MKDPHVETLIYRLAPVGSVTYKSPEPVEFEVEQFRGRLADGILTCKMKEHCASVEEARKIIEQHLRGWEIDVDLRLGRGELRFDYKNAEVIDRNSPEPYSGVRVVTTVARTIKLQWSVCVTRERYPDPPTDFRLTPDVETLWNRYQMYLDGREPLQAMAYFCLTVLEMLGGGRECAAKKYSISKDILNKLGKLTSKRGDLLSARKAGGAQSPLASAERDWIEATIKRIIRRVGEHAAGIPLSTITMNDIGGLKKAI